MMLYQAYQYICMYIPKFRHIVRDQLWPIVTKIFDNVLQNRWVYG